jgi:uncharacterized membrane protein
VSQAESAVAGGSAPPSGSPSNPIRNNVRTIAEIEAEYSGKISRTDQVGRQITRLVGTIYFALGHALGVTLWALWNTQAPEPLRFDPFPFGILALVVSVEGVLLATFVLITQNRESRAADRRSHLALQVNLLIEQELTAVLRQLSEVFERIGVTPAAIDQELLAETRVTEVVEQIDRQITQTDS